MKKYVNKTAACWLLALALLAGLFTGCSSNVPETSAEQTEAVTEVIGEDGIKLSNDSSDFVLLS